MTRKLFLSAILILSLLGLPAAASTWVPLNGAQVQESAPAVQLQRSDYTSVQFKVDIRGFSFETIQTKGGAFATLRLGEEGYATQIGSPRLPVLRELIEIPFGAQVSLTFGPLVMRQATLAEFGLTDRIMPVQPPVEKMPGALEAAPFVLDETAYNRPGYMIGQFARIVEEGQMRDHRYVLVEIYPFDYSPADGRLQIISSIEINLNFSGADVGLTRQIKTRYGDQYFDAQARRTFLNPGFMAEDLVPLPLGLLVITNNHYAALPTMTDLVTWKKNKGFHVTVATTEQIGTSTAAIKAYIQNAYNTWPIPPDFVVLVGDVNVIPNWVGSGSGSPATDLYYGTLAGGDIFADVGLGRLSPSTDANLALMINKTLNYEQAVWSFSTWIKKATFMASNDNYSISEGTHNFVISNYLDPELYASFKLYCHTYGATTQQVSDNLNAGRSLGIYSGHGDVTLWADGPPFNQSNVNALTNTVYPFICSHACLTGQFTAGECFGETWLRTQHGTFAFWGSSVTSYWDEDDILEKGMFEGFYNEQSPQQDQDLTWIGGMTDYGKHYLYDHYGGGGSTLRYFEMYNILGDPSVDLWTDVPQNLTVSFPGAVLIGQPTVTVNVSGYPHWAMVNIYSSAEDMMFTQYVGAGGVTTFNLGGGFTLPGTLHVWVTGHDCMPYHGTAQIIPPSGPYVIYNSCQINDATIGNNNGQWDFAETTDLNLGVKNVGIAAANNVSATISENDPLVTVLDSTTVYGTVNAGDSVVVPAGFRVQAAGNTPDQHSALFSLTATASNGGPWTSSFNLVINAPVLTQETLVIQDPAPGNNNGALDPGESTTFLLTMINAGHSAAQNVAVTMTSNNAQVTIAGNPGGFGNMIVGATATDSWTVVAGSGINPGTIVRFTLNVTATGGYSHSEDFELIVGDVRNSPTGPDSYGYRAWDNMDGGEAHPYTWIEVNPSQGGPGTPIAFTQDDQTVPLELPFIFRYYGQNFMQISICTNGWIAMGVTTNSDYSNSGIPNGDGPPNMIAAYWHDLSPQLGGRVVYYYDPTQHYLVVEFDSVRHYSPASSRETFEIVLYDPAYYPTSTGDGEILVQYKLVTDGNVGTIGIENQAQTVGVQYGFNNTWDVHAWPTQAGRTITYSTNVSGPPPAVDVTLDPINPPIVIPASGGSFSYNATMANNGSSPASFSAWIMQYTPGGTWQGPMLGPVSLTLPAGVTVTRLRNQNVPGSASPGVYTYRGYVGIYSNTKWDSSSFTYTKSTTGAGPVMGNWDNWGESFAPYENVTTVTNGVASSSRLEQNSPNPFNPTTAIRYQLTALSHVSLRVYDTAGRLVTTLIEGMQETGTHQVTFDGSRLSSGLYFVRLQAGDFSAVQKMMLIK
jgi:hypothetical protein